MWRRGETIYTNIQNKASTKRPKKITILSINKERWIFLMIDSLLLTTTFSFTNRGTYNIK